MFSIDLTARSITPSEQPQLLPESPSESKSLSKEKIKGFYSKVEVSVKSPKSPTTQVHTIANKSRLGLEEKSIDNHVDDQIKITIDQKSINDIKDSLLNIDRKRWSGSSAFKSLASDLVSKLESLKKPHSLNELKTKYQDIAQKANELLGIANSFTSLNSNAKKDLSDKAIFIADEIYKDLMKEVGDKNKLALTNPSTTKDKLVIELIKARGALGELHKGSEFKRNANDFIESLNSFDPNAPVVDQVKDLNKLYTKYKNFERLGYEDSIVRDGIAKVKHNVTKNKSEFCKESLNVLVKLSTHISLTVHSQVQNEFEAFEDCKETNNLDKMDTHITNVDNLLKIYQQNPEKQSKIIVPKQKLYDIDSNRLKRAIDYRNSILTGFSNPLNDKEKSPEVHSENTFKSLQGNEVTIDVVEKSITPFELARNSSLSEGFKETTPRVLQRNEYSSEDENDAKQSLLHGTDEFGNFGEPSLNTSVESPRDQVSVEDGETSYSKFEASLNESEVNSVHESGPSINENSYLDNRMNREVTEANILYSDDMLTRIKCLALCDELLSDVAKEGKNLTRVNMVTNLKPLVLGYFNVRDRLSLMDSDENVIKIDNLRRFILNTESLESQIANANRKDSQRITEKVTQDQVIEILFGSKLKTLEEIISTRKAYIDTLGNLDEPHSTKNLGLVGDILNQLKSLDNEYSEGTEITDNLLESDYEEDDIETSLGSTNNQQQEKGVLNDNEEIVHKRRDTLTSNLTPEEINGTDLPNNLSSTLIKHTSGYISQDD